MTSRLSARSRIGEVVGRGGCLTAIAIGPPIPRGQSLVVYRCKYCGSETAILPSNAKKYASCGCRKGQHCRQGATTHGQTGTPTYINWKAMLARCNNRHAKNYDVYGGAGITVCERWLSFENFLEDMGERPTPDHSIDRIDGAKVYSKATCRWATRVEQAVNRRSTHLLTIYGKTMCAAHWAPIGCGSVKAVHQRLKRGWPAKAAVFAPLGWKLERWNSNTKGQY